ncbi:peptide-N(4)-(N-acetyl-beta-glucosaminyl)asparagine amidase [Battus philenor]|uniref:peptide-N(4)-(N-acetyl-beta- glucosaminyl)asparagine amidase n=1 Tax=Battus philenor TaxID=42288 RepID=UPI0035CF0623
MEGVARLAVVEQTLSDVNEFNKLLHDLLESIERILDNPYDVKKLKSTSNIENATEHEVFREYLNYIGFELVDGEYMYTDNTVIKLRTAQSAIQRKICICYGSKKHLIGRMPTSNYVISNEPKLKEVYLETNNSFLESIESLFNSVLEYEKDDVKAMAREQIPIVTLEMKAIERVREHQRKLKVGEVKGNDLSFEIALLMELLVWFKYKFFTWMDKPECETCGGTTTYHNYQIRPVDRERGVKVEIYKCTVCNEKTNFPRYKNPATLLRTRRGRCGEWANCFALLCRSLGYDTRHVYDTTDHVWCEVYDHETGNWLHVDPCECLLDAPLVYSCGWNKKLCYVIAASRDDLQDVTWRYITDHKEVLKRRKLCGESELISYIMTLRNERQKQVTEARKQFLLNRGLKELVQLMVEKKPGEYETRGRISGSKEWREERGEMGKVKKSHTFKFNRPGNYSVLYYTVPDKYRILRDGEEFQVVDGFVNGTYECEHMIRNVEKDWGKVYLAREEDESRGFISWKLAVIGEDLVFDKLSIDLSVEIYANAFIVSMVQFDDEPPQEMELYRTWKFQREFKQMVVSCTLTGGMGDVAWQHAQLFRQRITSNRCLFTVEANVVKKE